MSLWYTSISLVYFLFCGMITIFITNQMFKGTVFSKSSFWRNKLSQALLTNLVGFVTVTLIFFNIYHFISDDNNYYYMPENYVQPGLFEVDTPIHYMWFITWPFKHYFFADVQSMHVLFAMLGLAGSALLFRTYMDTVDLREKSNRKFHLAAFWSLLCFPNFVAWGRFYGKDSHMFMWGAVFVYCAQILLNKKGFSLGHAVLAAVAAYFMYQVRPHVSSAFCISLLTTQTAKYIFSRENISSANVSPAKILVPLAAPAILITIVLSTFSGMTGSETVSLEAATRELEAVGEMGNFGGSRIGNSMQNDDNEKMIFNPVSIAGNLFNLYFAPMPWQIRGAYQIIAFVSNVILMVLLIQYGKNISLRTPWTWFLLLNVILLSVILSFISTNIGLIMRQKIIFLPSLFLLLFTPSGKMAARKRNRSAMPRIASGNAR